jgi:hypothetical protein
MTEAQEDAIYEAQDQWISAHFGLKTPTINSGWFVDEVDGYISTKIYGHGILTTDIHLNHLWEPYE